MIDFKKETTYKDSDFDSLKTTCSTCTKCDLSETRTQTVFGKGPVPCDLMVIGEAPGQQEDEKGYPFVGKAGQLLTKIFESVGIIRETDLYITNTVKCRPPNNRDPHPTEISACNDFLVRQIQLVKPKVLILLGNPSLKTILGEEHSITKVRGQWFKADVDYMDEQLYIMPLFHPAFLLRNASKEPGKPKWLTWTDMKDVKSALDFYAEAVS